MSVDVCFTNDKGGSGMGMRKICRKRVITNKKASPKVVRAQGNKILVVTGELGFNRTKISFSE